MRVTVESARRASTGAISLGIPITAMGRGERCCAVCPAGRTQHTNVRTASPLAMLVREFVLRKVCRLSHTRIALWALGGGAARRRFVSRQAGELQVLAALQLREIDDLAGVIREVFVDVGDGAQACG